MELPNTKNSLPNHEISGTPLGDIRPHLLFSTDYTLPEGHPERYAAVYASEEEMTTMLMVERDGQMVYYRHRLGDSVIRSVLPAREAKAIFLAESELKITAPTMGRAIIQATQVGLGISQRLPLQ